MFGNWNRALQVAEAPYIALLHDDDLLEPDYISKMINALNLHSNVGVITHVPYLFVNNSKENPFSSLKMMIRKGLIEEVDWREYLFGNVTSSSCMIINKECGISIGGWSLAEYPSSDYFFNARIAYKYKVLRYYMPISIYRLEVNASLQNDVKVKFQSTNTKFLMASLNNDLRISKITRLIAELPLYQRIKLLEGSESVTFPGVQNIVMKFNKFNKYALYILSTFRRVYLIGRRLRSISKSRRIN
jgi:hypothetical protein